MLPLSQRYAFAIFAVVTVTLGCRGLYRVYLRVMRGSADTEPRTTRLGMRLWYSIRTTLTQERVFRKRPLASIFHSFIFYAFVVYLLVNTVDAVDGFFPLHVRPVPFLGGFYGFVTDGFSLLAMAGVIALAFRRFLLPSRRDFKFNQRTLLDKDVRHGYIHRDSLIVSMFILVHVGSRVVANGARLAIEGQDRTQPLSTFVAHAFIGHDPERWRVLGYWGALGSALLFLAYFPYSKHIHLVAAPFKYFFRRQASTGELPPMEIDLEQGTAEIGAATLKDLAWPRLLDAYACIQCNRCQDVCPASKTGKALSPAALEINKRMVLNRIGLEVNPLSLTGRGGFEAGTADGGSLLQAVISPESVWACTTCGACMEVCPTQNEQMLDIIDIRRNLVMQQGEFPKQLQSAFKGMERVRNPWGLAPQKRMDWADSLQVPTVEELPDPDVLYWVGCAASYDPDAQKTARAMVQLLRQADVKFAVLGRQECCTGDSARRAGNELLYQQLAKENVATLNRVRPRIVVASCPHCVNTISDEYPQLGGRYTVMHHTEYFASLLAQKKLTPAPSDITVTFHDPCYLGRHRGSYDQPRSVLNVLSTQHVELERSRNNAFCCGAGGAQFWKEEEPGHEQVSENRFKEVERSLGSASGEKVLAVGCPFCKSMLQSTPSAAERKDILIKDVAELLWEGVRRNEVVNAGAVSRVDHVPSVREELPVSADQPAVALSELQSARPAEVDLKTLEREEDELERAPAPIDPKRENRSPEPSPSGVSAPLQTEREKLAGSLTPQADTDEKAVVPARKKWKPGVDR